MTIDTSLTTVEKLHELTRLRPEVYFNDAVNYKEDGFTTGHSELFGLIASQISVLKTSLPAGVHARKDSLVGEDIDVFYVSRKGHFLSSENPLNIQFNAANNEVVRISRHSSYDGGPPIFYDVGKMAEDIAATRVLVDKAHALNTISNLTA